MEISNSSEKFKATPEWMSEKYDELNQWLFDGKLGRCDFSIFTTGKGSQGGYLGWFCIQSSGLKADRSTRRIYRKSWNGDKVLIDKRNFYDECRPLIKMNGHYSGTEFSLLSTLLHEMCHYYTYMNGYAPTQGHGTDFKRVCNYVAYKSNGVFSINTVATAEEMTGYELDDEMKEKRQKRKENKINRMKSIIVIRTYGKIELTTTSNSELINEIINRNIYGDLKNSCETILFSDSRDSSQALFNLGYNKNMRSYRIWTISPEKWEQIKDLDFRRIKKEVWENTNNDYLKILVEKVVNNLLNDDESYVDIMPGEPLSLKSPLE